jgi:hypothetical protein
MVQYAVDRCGPAAPRRDGRDKASLAMPITSPAASATGAPEKAGYKPPSRPDQLVDAATAPGAPLARDASDVAETRRARPEASRPTANTKSPMRGAAAAARPAIGNRPRLEGHARQVDAAVDARTCPGTCSPSGNAIDTLDARHSADALVTNERPERHSTPEPARRGA